MLINARELSGAAARLVSAGPLMVMPCTDEVAARRSMALACSRAKSDGLMVAVLDADRMGFIAVANQVFRASQSPWFGFMAQDAFAGRDWMALALKALQKPSAAFLGFNDGKWHGQLASFGLASRAWAEKVYGGDLFFPGYQSHFADVELTLVARQQACYVYEPDSVLVEVDWDKEQAKVNTTDRSLFQARRMQGFGQRVSDPVLLGLFA
jgi:hypothetical protein